MVGMSTAIAEENYGVMSNALKPLNLNARTVAVDACTFHL